jgi:hypothetical protein
MKTIIAAISDLHVGSSVGLCPKEGIKLDDGGVYQPSRYQKELLKVWYSFHQYVASLECNRRVLVVNGDIVDGAHHGAVALVTNNIAVQERAAIQLLSEILPHYQSVYVTRGTEAHVEAGAQCDERIAHAIGAERSNGNYSAWQWWLDVDGVLFNIAHHISSTSSAAYESSAVMREMTAAFFEAGQWGQKIPDVLVRSHRHRYIEVAIPSSGGVVRAVVTPGWQLRTPFVERIDRMRLPNIGGIVFVVEDKRCQIIPKVYPFHQWETMKV